MKPVRGLVHWSSAVNVRSLAVIFWRVPSAATRVSTTPKGAKTARNAAESVIEGERAAYDHLSTAERALLLELLHKVASRRPR